MLAMSFLILLIGVLTLILLTTWAKLNAFLSFLIVSMGIGLANGMSIESVTHAVQTGMGELLGSLLVILVVGAMLGKLIADYGAAKYDKVYLGYAKFDSVLRSEPTVIQLLPLNRPETAKQGPKTAYQFEPDVE